MNFPILTKQNILYIACALGVSAVSVFLLRKLVKNKPKSRLRELIFRTNPSVIEKLSTREEFLTEHDLSFIVFIRAQESQKPKKGVKTTNPFLYPFEPGMLIKNFENNYRLLFNKYPIINKHLLLVTYQFEKQSDPLTKEDLDKAYEVISEVDGFAFFNSGEHSGYSQEHKHIQIIPYESISRFPLEQQISSIIQDDAFTLPIYDFKHFFHAIPASEPKDHLFSIYTKLLNLLSPSSYNFILTQN